MSKLTLTKVEKWEGLAWTSFFWTIALSAPAAICVWWLAPRLDIHSVAVVFGALGVLLFAVATAVAGAVGLVSASVLFLRNHIISWYGIACPLISGLFVLWVWLQK